MFFVSFGKMSSTNCWSRQGQFVKIWSNLSKTKKMSKSGFETRQKLYSETLSREAPQPLPPPPLPLLLVPFQPALRPQSRQQRRIEHLLQVPLRHRRALDVGHGPQACGHLPCLLPRHRPLAVVGQLDEGVGVGAKIGLKSRGNKSYIISTKFIWK